ncbi:hypothetical protein QJQ45_011834 [Haematococcus lacustris]|nr:hypothetical protein QJQ45_011834 [Haematococcus lacustris]
MQVVATKGGKLQLDVDRIRARQAAEGSAYVLPRMQPPPPRVGRGSQHRWTGDSPLAATMQQLQASDARLQQIHALSQPVYGTARTPGQANQGSCHPPSASSADRQATPQPQPQRNSSSRATWSAPTPPLALPSCQPLKQPLQHHNSQAGVPAHGAISAYAHALAEAPSSMDQQLSMDQQQLQGAQHQLAQDQQQLQDGGEGGVFKHSMAAKVLADHPDLSAECKAQQLAGVHNVECVVPAAQLAASVAHQTRGSVQRRWCLVLKDEEVEKCAELDPDAHRLLRTITGSRAMHAMSFPADRVAPMWSETACACVRHMGSKPQQCMCHGASTLSSIPMFGRVTLASDKKEDAEFCMHGHHTLQAPT